MYFEQSKKKTTSYTLKSNDITLDIKVTTLALSITTNSIRIEYLIEETKTKYEYYIGWSD